MNLSSQKPFSDSLKNQDDGDVYISEILASIRRHPFVFGAITLTSVILSAFHASTQTPVWEGYFQIVLGGSDRTGNKLAQSFASMSGAIPMGGAGGGGFGEPSVDIKTEVTVLQSPSVLNSVFLKWKELKIDKGDNVDNVKFGSWAGGVNIRTTKGSRVLRIAYRDTNKDFVLPIVKQITVAYQDYSDLQRKDNLDNGLQYTKEQLDIFREVAANSNSVRDRYQLRYGIKSDNSESSGPAIDFNRVFSGVDDSDLVGGLVNSSGSGTYNRNENSISQLASINKELRRRREIFTEEDPSIKALLRVRKSLRKYIEASANGFMAEPDMNAGDDKALDIMLRYQELNRKAKRDYFTLSRLEDNLLRLQLEKARTPNPWRLVSYPELLDAPVSPNKRQIVMFGWLIGLVLGTGSAFAIDKQSGLIFAKRVLEEVVPYPLLASIPAKKPENWSIPIGLMSEGPLGGKVNGSVGLVPIGNLPKDQLDEFTKQLTTSLGSRDLVVSRDPRETRKCSSQILIISLGTSKSDDLKKTFQDLALQGAPVSGWVMLDPGPKGLF